MGIVFENSNFIYSVSFFSRRHHVTSKVSGRTIRASDEQVAKLRFVLGAHDRMDWGGLFEKDRARKKILIAFCLTVHGLDAVVLSFMSQPPETVALMFGTMPEG